MRAKMEKELYYNFSKEKLGKLQKEKRALITQLF